MLFLKDDVLNRKMGIHGVKEVLLTHCDTQVLYNLMKNTFQIFDLPSSSKRICSHPQDSHTLKRTLVDFSNNFKKEIL